MDVLRIIKVSDEENYVLISGPKSNITNNSEYIITIPEDVLIPIKDTKKVVISIDGVVISLVGRSVGKFVNNTELKNFQKSNCGVYVLRVVFSSKNHSFKIVS